MDANTLNSLTIPALPYMQVRPLIRSGDVLLCSGASPMAKMIQYATDSIFSHVAFLLRLESLDRLMVLESVESIGIRACTLGSYITDYNGTRKPYPGRLYLARHRHVNLQDPSTLRHFSQHAVDLLGYPYDTREILSITARIVADKLGMTAKPARANHTYICSEYCQECFASLGIHIPYDARNFIAPADFARCPDITVLREIALPTGDEIAAWPTGAEDIPPTHG